MRRNFHLNEPVHQASEERMTARTQLWLWPNLLSLDAPVVALLWQVLFVRCFHARLDGPTAILLATAVWLIYAADRMLDAWRGSVRTRRHAFYQRHWRIVSALWIAVFVAGGWMAWTWLPEALWPGGLAMTGIAGVYLVAVHGVPVLRLAGLKEAAVGLVFAAGVSLVAWPMVRTSADFLAIILFCVLCWMNCLGIEDWERGSEARSSVVYAGAMVALLAVVLLAERRPVLACAETASALGVIALDRFRGRFSRDAIRVLADVVLLTPILFLGVAGRAV
jgi:hypothetical protein